MLHSEKGQLLVISNQNGEQIIIKDKVILIMKTIYNRFKQLINK